MAAPNSFQPGNCRDPDEDIFREVAVFGQGGFQVLKAAYLFKPYSLHVDICLAVANGRNFALGLQSGELSVSLLVRS